jgi:methylmalonyl-CoA/ethylmalonyl-CoA epimerase
MNKYGLKFHHLGLAVRKPEDTIRWLLGLGYDIGRSVRDDLQNVNLVLCTSENMPSIEIISETGTPGPLTTVLNLSSTRIYHVCFETQCLAQTLEAIQREDPHLTMISEPKPALLFGGRHVSFYHVQGFGMIEILEAELGSDPNGP